MRSVFSVPWSNITGSAETLADSHSTLASKIEVDVERPLREFTSTNREMSQMSTVQGNLTALAKDVERAQSKMEKVQGKGDRAEAGKVANANSDLDTAQTQWESQAPYVFENLQSLDESRINHLRDVLTQFQTHEVDLVEKNRVTAESCLNVLLNLETKDEITTFALKAVQQRPTPAEKKRGSVSTPMRPPPTTAGSSSLAPSISRSEDDRTSQAAESIPEDKQKGRLKGLRRLGTVMGRKRESKYGSPLPTTAESPERKPKPSPFNSFAGRLGRSKDASSLEPMQETSPRQRPASPMRYGSEVLEPPRTGSSVGASTPPATASSSLAPPPQLNGAPQLSLPNGSHQSDLSDLEPPKPTTPLQERSSSLNAPAAVPEPQKDDEGFTVPPLDVDPITAAQREAAMAGEGDPTAPQFNVNIRDAPIQEDSGSADALASVAGKLVSLCTPSVGFCGQTDSLQQAPPITSRTGTVRGRRGPNRNSFVPSVYAPPEQAAAESSSQLDSTSTREAPEPASPEATAPAVQAPQSPPGADLTQSPSSAFNPSASTMSAFSAFAPHAEQQTSPSLFRPDSRAATALDQSRGDNQSIRSATTTASQGGIKHPELHETGLNSSIVETVGARFENGQLTSSSLVGEIALAYNTSDPSSTPGTDTIRLDNFASLEKVAPNPAFIAATADRDGEYSVNLSSLPRTQVAFKYQLRHDDVAARAPLLITPAFKIEATQVSVIISYALHFAFKLPEGQSSITLSNVMLALTLEGTKAKSCQSKPVGTFSREKNLIFWQLGDVTLSPDAAPQKMLARFATEGEASGGHVEARWEVAGEGAKGVGSGIGVSVAEKKADDPFADEDAAEREWRVVPGVKRVTAGHYGAK